MSEDVRSILVVDDQEDIRDIVTAHFEPKGFRVYTASEGQSGFEIIEASKPDCVLLDVKIPEGDDGYTLLRRLRAYKSDDESDEEKIRKVPVIILTGSGPGMKPIFDIEGISGFLEKPFELEDLEEKVNAAIS